MNLPSVRIARLRPNGSIATFAPIASRERFFLSRSVLSLSSVASCATSPACLAALSRCSSSGVGGTRGNVSRYCMNSDCISVPTPLMSLTCSRCRTLIGQFMTPLTTFWSALIHVSLLRRSTETMRILSKYNANSTLPGCLHSLVMGEGIWRSARASAMHRHMSPVSIRCFAASLN